MPPTHMPAHHRGGVSDNPHRATRNAITISHTRTVPHTHRTPTWTWTFIQPKPHTHPEDIAREPKRISEQRRLTERQEGSLWTRQRFELRDKLIDLLRS